MASQIGEKVDGRHKRALRSREHIVAATLELVCEGNINPTAKEIAVRANLGLRSVFRHFKTMEDLYKIIVLELIKRVELASPPLQSSDWLGQIDEIMNQRVTIFETLLPFKRASDGLRHTSPVMQADYNARVSSMRTRVIGILPAAILNRQPLLEAIDLALSFEAWQRLRMEQKLSVADAREAVATLLSHLLANHPNAVGVSPEISGR